MKVYRLRESNTGRLYKGNGNFDSKGKIYTNKGHIKNSLGQSWGNKFPSKDMKLEIITYELTEIKTEPL